MRRESKQALARWIKGFGPDSAKAGMKAAIQAAARGVGSTYPNPCVGAAVFVDDRVVSQSRTGTGGAPHAEARCLAKLKRGEAQGATLFVTLEPCNHFGRTPPCTDAIIHSGVRTVVVGVRDPDKRVRGRGIRKLRSAGVEVIEGYLASEIECVHEHYLFHARTGRPWVTLKAAVSLDGRMATGLGDSRWITNESSRKEAHRMRARHHAIAVGVGTVLADDPRLNVRHVRGRDPLAVIFDSRLRLSSSIGKFQLSRPGTIVVHSERASAAARSRMEAAGFELVLAPQTESRCASIGFALDGLGQIGIRSLMVEGGGKLLGSFVEGSYWQRFSVFQAPTVLLGAGCGLLGATQFPSVSECPNVELERVVRLGDNMRYDLRPAL